MKVKQQALSLQGPVRDETHNMLPLASWEAAIVACGTSAAIPPSLPCRYCLEVHARAGMIADVGTVHEILLDLLPSVMRGEAVDTLQLKRPWPTIKPEGDGHTGLWWDVQ